MEDTDVNGNVNARSGCILFDQYRSFNARTFFTAASAEQEA